MNFLSLAPSNAAFYVCLAEDASVIFGVFSLVFAGVVTMPFA